MYDTHVHSKYSNDGKESFFDICESAKNKGLVGICITDHIDPTQNQNMNDDKIINTFFEDFVIAKENSNGIDLISGFEFSEPQNDPSFFEYICSFPFSYKMCSVHHDTKYGYPSPTLDYAEYILDYLENVKRTVYNFNFDVLGHIDLPRKYFHRYDLVENSLLDIFNVMIDKDIALEINTSVFNYKLEKIEPNLRKKAVTLEDLRYLELYKESGGIKVTLGSDAHRCEDIGRYFNVIKDSIPSGLVIGHVCDGIWFEDIRV